MSLVPKLPELRPGGGTSGTTSARGTTTSRGLVSATNTKYVVSPRAAPDSRVLSPRDLRSINKYIGANRSLQPQHRAGKIADLIPPPPFEKVTENRDTNLGLRIARVNPRESALDIPLRFCAPEDMHVPAVSDLPTAAGASSSLASRIVKLLKGTSQVPQHSADEKVGTERDVAHCTVIRDWEMRATVAKRGEKFRAHGTALFALGALHYSAANRAKAMRYFSDAAQVYEGGNDARGAALCHNLIGVCLMHDGRHNDALTHHRKQLTLSGDYGRAVAQLNMGVCYGALGEHEFAEQAFSDGLRSAGDAADEVLTTIAHGNLGIALLRQGDLKNSQHHVEQCLERCSVAGDKVGAAVCLLLLADIYNSLNDYPHAQFYAEHAMRVATEAHCTELADVAKVTIGVARGAQRVQQAVVDSARSMGNNVMVTDVIATLPRS